MRFCPICGCTEFGEDDPDGFARCKGCGKVVDPMP